MTIITDVVGFQLDVTKSSVTGVTGAGGNYTPISGTGTGSTSFVALSDAATANIPVFNSPTAAALALLAPLLNAALLGTPTAPTPGSTDNSTKLATTAMVQAAIASSLVGFLDLKGSISAAANPNYPVALKGDTYLISAAGLIGGTSGIAVNVGDVIVASAANAGGTQAAVGTSWFVLEHQIAGALLATNNLSDVSNISTARLNLVLDQVNNTSDANKPVSTAQAAAIAARARAYRGVAASQTAMLALSAAVVGDWCERSDLANQVFELTTAGPATLANWTAYPSGGVTTFAALTDAASATIAVTNTSVANALALKANAASPVLTGVVSHSGADQIAGTAVAGNVVDFNVGKNVQPALTAPTTVAFANSVTDRATLWQITGNASAAYVVTLPAGVHSIGQQATVSTFTVPANWEGYISLICTGAGTFDMAGEPIALSSKAIAGRFATGANDTQVITLYAPYAGTISNFITQSASGTATYQLTINGVNVTGGVNAVSSTLVNSAPSAANVVAVGNVIAIVRSLDATCVNGDWTVLISPSKV